MVFVAVVSEALIEACARAHSSLVSHLLQSGVNVNGKLENGWTALMTACRGGRLQVAELLLIHGATVDEGAPHLNALAIACLHGHTSIVQLLVEHGARQLRLDKGKDALMASAQFGHAAVRPLVETGTALSGKRAPACVISLPGQRGPTGAFLGPPTPSARAVGGGAVSQCALKMRNPLP